MRNLLGRADVDVGSVDLLVENGRVRAGYHVGGLLGVEVVVHLIGERPGTGLNTLSAYLTYGRDAEGRPLWSPDLTHSCTTAVYGIHRRGRRPETTSEEIARYVVRMFETRRSGIALGKQ